MRKRKIKSTTMWFSIWAALVLTGSIIIRVNLPWFDAVAPILAGLIVTYTIGNKAVDFKHGPDQEPEKEGS
jgi:hypothetical protein